MCRMDAIQYWTANSPLPSNEQQNTINSLMQQYVKKAEPITSYDWEGTKFIVGTVHYNRMPLPLNPEYVDVPKELRIPALSMALDLSNYVEYTEVPLHYLTKIKDLIKGSSISLQSIPNMIHFLQSQLDPKIRHIPMLPGIDTKYIPMIHALVQPTYRATNIGSKISPRVGKNQILTNLCSAVIHFIDTNKYSYRTLTTYLAECKIYGVSAITLIEETDENKITRFVKGVIGFPISPCVTRGIYKFYPLPSGRLYKTILYNATGNPYEMLNGVERIYFEGNSTKGFFDKNSNLIGQLTFMKTTKGNLSPCA